ncbi:DUF4251 domain-containing protein [Prevotella aurantiaca]|uniref:DUF4251 domain-containing protein n=1 Tax=Prevotella aurantiaca TaxID=596085 RepID=UPI0028E3B8F5|nr:DUF4251 domain-containing protein [Prevotella aurantiaca]
MKKNIILSLSVVVLFGCATTYRDSEGNIVSREKIDALRTVAVKRNLDERRFRIFIDKIYPVGMPVRTLNSDYVIEVSRDSIGMELPYIGRLDRAPINGYVGLHGILPIRSYKSEPTKDGERIFIEAHNETEIYNIILNVYNNGTTNISLKSNIRSSIDYSGFIQLNAKFVPIYAK